METTCARCGGILPAEGRLYDDHGNPACQKCLLDEQVRASQSRAAGKVKAVAYSGPVLGLVAFLWNPWWLFSVAAIGNGIYVLQSLRDQHGHPDLKSPRPAQRGEVAERSEAGEGLPISYVKDLDSPSGATERVSNPSRDGSRPAKPAGSPRADTTGAMAIAVEKMKVAAIAGMVLGGVTALLQVLNLMGKLAR